MNMFKFAAACGVAALACASASHANQPENWIALSQAITTAKQAVTGGVPIKAELDNDSAYLYYEVLLIKNDSLYQVEIHPETGAVLDTDIKDGGGAQDKMATAQQVISQSAYTLEQALEITAQNWPDFFVSQIDMRLRNGVAVFQAEMMRGTVKLEVHIRAADGVIIKRQYRTIGVNSVYADLYTGTTGELWDTTGLLDASQMRGLAMDRFPNASIFKIELNRYNTVYRYEVEMVRAGNLMKAKFNARTGQLINTKTIDNSSKLSKVQTSLAVPQISLAQAMTIGKNAVPGGFAIEGELRLQEQGKRYQVELLTNAGFVEVKISSATGKVLAVDFDD